MQEQTGHREPRSGPATPLGIDPVCGMEVPLASPHRHALSGSEAVFCSARCRARFASDPSRYPPAEEHEPSVTRPSTPSADAPSTRASTCPMHPEVRADQQGSCPKGGVALELASSGSPASTEWVCPMHPEVVRRGPGTCPRCGMALEPRAGSASQKEEGHELRDMKRRFWFAAAVTLPLVLLAMSDLLPGQPISRLLSARERTMIELLLATPVCTWAAWPFFVRAVESVKNRSLNMFTLIGLGVSVAYLYSLVAALLPGIFPASFRGVSGEVAVYFEAGGVIVTLILLGQVLELRARNATGNAIEKLLGLAPKTARRLDEDGSEADVSLDVVVVGDRLRVRPGEKIPVDGIVLQGASAIDPTEGKPKLVCVVPRAELEEKTLLRLAATLELGSEHPLAAAIVRGSEERGVDLGEATGFESITGRGVRGDVDGRAVALGNLALMTQLEIDLGDLAERAEAVRVQGQTVMFVAVDGKLAGFVGVADPSRRARPRPSARCTRRAFASSCSPATARRPREPLRGVWGSTRSSRASSPIRRWRPSSGCRARGASLPWQETASTTRPRSLGPRSASRWEPEPTSRWRARR